MVSRFSTTTRSMAASVRSSSAREGAPGASRPKPGTTWSTGPAPATVTVRNPRSDSAERQVSVTTETPSVPPRRKETKAAVALGTRLAQPHTSWAVSTTSRSLATCSS